MAHRKRKRSKFQTRPDTPSALYRSALKRTNEDKARAVALLEAMAQGQELSDAQQVELREILGCFPATSEQAAEWRTMLRSWLKAVREA